MAPTYQKEPKRQLFYIHSGSRYPYLKAYVMATPNSHDIPEPYIWAYREFPNRLEAILRILFTYSSVVFASKLEGLTAQAVGS